MTWCHIGEIGSVVQVKSDAAKCEKEHGQKQPLNQNPVDVPFQTNSGKVFQDLHIVSKSS